MAKSFNVDALVKKLKNVSNTQDSIPMLSLWIIHHKSHHKLIVDTWLDVLKKSKTSHKLTLLYLANDVIQNCNRKKAPVFKDSFSDVLPEAVTVLRDAAIKSNVQRVVKIWAKRGIFDVEFTDQLLAALITNRAPEKLRNKLLIEYKTSHLIDEVKKFKALEDEIESDQNRLKSLRVDVSSSDAIRKLKDKSGGEKFSKEFEESATQLENFLERFEMYIERRKSLLELLEQGTVYYHAQYHEAKIVVNAYKNFEGRVNKMKRGLDKVVASLPTSSADVQHDSRGEDMEMSDDDKELGNKPSKIVAMDTRILGSQKVPPSENASTTVTSAAEDVIKLLALELETIKNSNEPASPSKSTVTGLVNRPGLRGASDNTADSMMTDVSRTSLTITRPIAQSVPDVNKGSEPNTPGTASPPSPTGSPELNISSPPRQQSLESRLADIFNDAVVAGADKVQSAASVESDSDSDTSKLIKRATASASEKNLGATFLPGLGNLDEIKPSDIKLSIVNDTKPPSSKYQSASAGTNITTSSHNNSQPPTTVNQASSSATNQSIPVIGGLTRVSGPPLDGSSTPTLDENPYTSTTQYNINSHSGIISPPRFSGDALTFLTRFMGQATKTELNSSEAASVAVLPSNPTPSSADGHYHSWPPTTQSTNDISPTWMPAWPRQAPLPQSWPQPGLPPLPPASFTSVALPPPPPVFSWPSAGVPSLPTWPQPTPSRSEQTWNSTSQKRESNALAENSTPKKLKWDGDKDYRGNQDDKVSSTSSPKSSFQGESSVNIANRRNSNLITLSSETNAPKPATSSESKEEKKSNVYEPMAMLRKNMRSNSEDGKLEMADIFPNPTSNVSPTVKSVPSLGECRNSQDTWQRKTYDSLGNPVVSDAAASVCKETFKPQNFENPPNVPYHPPPRFPRGRGTSFSPLQPPPRIPPPPNRFRPPVADLARAENELLQYELNLLAEERIRDAEILRDVTIREELGPPGGRGWRTGPPPRSPYMRPRLHRPPRQIAPLRGSRPMPRMHY
ncbi:uncharacterized protein LOC143449165 [Clavelina lepadiformis]|uniref:uncharacterized protein LOC143449165 n=1 Tax=Clavelina lepadiformis TaxID=159417 RepID=UPI004041DE45